MSKSEACVSLARALMGPVGLALKRSLQVASLENAFSHPGGGGGEGFEKFVLMSFCDFLLAAFEAGKCSVGGKG